MFFFWNWPIIACMQFTFMLRLILKTMSSFVLKTESIADPSLGLSLISMQAPRPNHHTPHREHLRCRLEFPPRPVSSPLVCVIQEFFTCRQCKKNFARLSTQPSFSAQYDPPYCYNTRINFEEVLTSWYIYIYQQPAKQSFYPRKLQLTKAPRLKSSETHIQKKKKNSPPVFNLTILSFKKKT